MNPRLLSIAIVLICVGTLAAAYLSQYGFGLKPCILCLYQRIPYFFAIGFGICGFIFQKHAKAFVLMATGAFLANAGVAGFHVGVEQGWWPGLPSCGGQILPESATLEELRAALTQQEIVRCDKPAFELFGISMAGYNFLLSLALGLAVPCLVFRRFRAPCPSKDSLPSSHAKN